MCKMKCPKHSGYTCGCLNTNEKNAPYQSVCLGPKDKKDSQKKEFVNYGVLYRVHERHPVTFPMFDENKYFKDDCSAGKR